MSADPVSPPPRIALLACSVLEQEIVMLAADAPHIRLTRFFEIGLHDQPDMLRQTLQAALLETDACDDIDAVVLAYGLCGLGTAGLRAGRHPFVLPRAHDCITMFLGSKEAYAAHQRRCPSCYYYTPGWNRARRVPGPDKIAAMREEYAGRFDEDDIDFLVESETQAWAQHDTATYIDLGTPNAAAEADYARDCARHLGWEFEHLRGDPALLRDLLWGRWDDARYQLVPPGSTLAHSPDEAILRVIPPSHP